MGGIMGGIFGMVFNESQKDPLDNVLNDTTTT
jgi:hypothetical protein